MNCPGEQLHEVGPFVVVVVVGLPRDGRRDQVGDARYSPAQEGQGVLVQRDLHGDRRPEQV